ncbi:MAG TPA: hypothetical protein VFE17_13570, partial [Candidatus Baltobacteraceae bacterium]|nr:hypothetical protein [Candidatus Baltobacteraceae bacterium]
MHTVNLPQMRGASATLVMRSSGLPAVAFFDDRPGSASAGVSKQSLTQPSCPSIPPIRITNPTPITFTIQISSLTIRLLCVPSSALFGASFFQIVPLPTVVSPTKLGDASISGSTLTFTPAVHQLTLPAHTTSEIVILPEQSTAEVALPVAPGSLTDLTANAPNVSSALSVTYQTASGGSLYSVSCFNAFSDGTLAQALQGVPLVGIPSFYCHLNPANGSTITF